MTKSVKWGQDLPAEARLRDFGVKWKVATVPLDSIDWDESRTNSARLNDPIDNSLVEEYGLAMTNGDTFPMPILRKKTNGKHVVQGGNHRAHASKSTGASSIQAYVIETNDQSTIDLLPRVLNRLHGARQSREEAVLHAMHAIQTYSFTIIKAGELFGVSDKSLGNEIRARDTREFLEASGINTSAFTKNALLSISKIPNNNVKLAVAQISANRRLNSPMVDELSVKVREQKTEASQMSVIAEMEKQTEGMSATTAPKITRPVRTKVIAWLTAGENYLGKTVKLSQLQITEATEIKRFKERAKDLSAKLLHLSGRKS